MYISGVSSTYDFSSYSTQRTQRSSGEDNKTRERSENARTEKTDSKGKTSGTQNLTDDKAKEVQKLQKRDTEVRQHEEAHRSAAGSLAKAPQYTFKTGPDGKQYAVGGSVDIDTSKGKTPEETIAKAEIVRRAALAPKNPSKQDLKIAEEASKTESSARQEQAAKRLEALKSYDETQKSSNSKADSQSDSAGSSSFELKGTEQSQGTHPKDTKGASLQQEQLDKHGELSLKASPKTPQIQVTKQDSLISTAKPSSLDISPSINLFA